jgi:hypothetical protein
MVRRAALAILAASTSFFAAPRARAFCRTTTDESFVPTAAQPCATSGSPLAWPDGNVGYWMNSAASAQVSFDEALHAASTAFGNWTGNALCPGDIPTCTGATTDHPSIDISYQGPTDVHAAEYKGDGRDENVILFWDSAWPHPDGDVTLALTTVTFGTSSGDIYDADVEVNSTPANPMSTADATPPGDYDLFSIFQHETGHFFGLAHTQPDNTSATMSARYKAGETFMRTLEADDVCGMCTIYPPGRATNQGLRAGCHCAIAGGAVSGVDGALFAACGVALVGVAARRRRRRR